MSKSEYFHLKIVLRYLSPPGINTEIVCLVEQIIDSGVVSVPENGCIMSLGWGLPPDLIESGDTLKLRFGTETHSDVVFHQAVSGTPRLVRNGTAKHEAYNEGSRGRRFISNALPRTAIGMDKSQEKLYLVAIEPSSRSRKIYGASLERLAYLMKTLGSYDAVNLDGGGSTIMLINGANVLNSGNPNLSRRVSSAITIEPIE